MVYFFIGDYKQKFYWGYKEILIFVFKNMVDVMRKYLEVDVFINFVFFCFVYDSIMEIMNYVQIWIIVIIVEGIFEVFMRKLIKKVDQKGVIIIGFVIVGGIKFGCFKIGNIGGMLDNILVFKLYCLGSVVYVLCFGGMFNEFNNIIFWIMDGVYEGVVIGGDRYLGFIFMDYVLCYQDILGVKMIVVFGEIGGIEEYKICWGIKEGCFIKFIVCWCIGMCVIMFFFEVQFGYVGVCVNQVFEIVVVKNQVLKEVGVFVFWSFDEFGEIIQFVYEDFVVNGVIVFVQEVLFLIVFMDYFWVREFGLICKFVLFMISICDE